MIRYINAFGAFALFLCVEMSHHTNGLEENKPVLEGLSTRVLAEDITYYNRCCKDDQVSVSFTSFHGNI